MKALRISAGLIAVAMGMGMQVQAQDAWEYRVTPYAYLPALDLDSTVAGQTVPVDMDFGDVWDSFDVMAFSIRGEAWSGVYGGIADFYWVDLDGDFGEGDAVNVQIEEWYLDLLGGYRWVKPSAHSRPSTMELNAGLRLHSLDQTVTPAAAPTRLGGSENWVDVMIGGRAMHPIAESWIVIMRGDVGGFDLTGGTDLNWSLTGGLGWEFTRDWLFDFGYRVYGIDYETGSGIENFGLDGIEHGLWLGVTWAP